MASLTARKPPPDATYVKQPARPPPPAAAVSSERTSSVIEPARNSSSSEGGWSPAPPPWVDDRATERCMGRACTVAFDSILERRHHCRLCGNVFCHSCSSKNAMLPPEWNIKEPQRVCNECFRIVLPHQTKWVRLNANAERENLLDDDATTRYMNSPLRFTLGGEIRKAAYSLHNLTDPTNVNFWERDVEYTTELLEAVEGLLFMTVGKIAFIGGLRVATGLLVARLPDGSWSAPCAVGSFGITFGACLGAEVTDMVTGVDKESMHKFCNEQVSNLMLGGEASLALGPFGRTASGEVHVPASGPASHSEAYMSYSQSRGAFGGVTVEAAYVKVRDDVNEKFYGYSVKAQQILDGTVPKPKAADPLYAAIQHFYNQVFPERRGGVNGFVGRVPGNGPVDRVPGNGPVDRMPGNGPVDRVPGNGPVNRMPGNGPVNRVPGNGPVLGSTGLEDDIIIDTTAASNNGSRGTTPGPALERYRPPVPTSATVTAVPVKEVPRQQHRVVVVDTRSPNPPPPPPPKSNPFGHFTSKSSPPAPATKPAPPPDPAAQDEVDFFQPRIIDGPFGESAQL